MAVMDALLLVYKLTQYIHIFDMTCLQYSVGWPPVVIVDHQPQPYFYFEFHNLFDSAMGIMQLIDDGLLCFGMHCEFLSMEVVQHTAVRMDFIRTVH